MNTRDETIAEGEAFLQDGALRCVGCDALRAKARCSLCALCTALLLGTRRESRESYLTIVVYIEGPQPEVCVQTPWTDTYPITFRTYEELRAIAGAEDPPAGPSRHHHVVHHHTGRRVSREETIAEGETFLEHGLFPCSKCKKPRVQTRGESCLRCIIDLSQCAGDDPRRFTVVTEMDETDAKP